MEMKIIKFQDEEYKKFNCLEDAESYRESLHGDDCMDNLRICEMPFNLTRTCTDEEFDELGNLYQDYLDQKDSGCCGFMDEKIFINEKMYIIGCNFGH